MSEASDRRNDGRMHTDLRDGAAALLVAFHFPPIQTSSGVHRALSLARYLPEYGCPVSVLTATPCAYEKTDSRNLALVPAGARVLRAVALDTTRHLSLGGRYLTAMARPDRWITWLPAAVMQGWLELRRRPAVILSTYPIATAHLIGWMLHRLTGFPWIADFRDPMAQDGYPADPRTHAWFRRIERLAVERASRLVFTAPSALEYYRERYPHLEERRLVLIANGYDEELFRDLPDGTSIRQQKPLIFLHSGILYPKERDPTAFFTALAMLHREGVLSPEQVRFVFRAAGNEERYGRQLQELGIGHLVEFRPPVDYRAALAEMRQADCLMVFQAADCNFQIPAKVYEYLRIGRPILGICDPAGDTAAVLRSAGIDTIAALDDAGEIAQILRRQLTQVEVGDAPLPAAEVVTTLSRREGCRRYAELIRQVQDEWPGRIETTAVTDTIGAKDRR